MVNAIGISAKDWGNLTYPSTAVDRVVLCFFNELLISGAGEIDVLYINDEKGEILLRSEEIPRLNMGRQAKTAKIPVLGEIASKGLQAMNFVRVRIAPAEKTDLNGAAVSGYCHIDWLDDAVMGDNDARRMIINGLTPNLWPGQKGGRCPEHCLGGIAAKG